MNELWRGRITGGGLAGRTGRVAITERGDVEVGLYVRDFGWMTLAPICHDKRLAVLEACVRAIYKREKCALTRKEKPPEGLKRYERID